MLSPVAENSRSARWSRPGWCGKPSSRRKKSGPAAPARPAARRCHPASPAPAPLVVGTAGVRRHQAAVEQGQERLQFVPLRVVDRVTRGDRQLGRPPGRRAGHAAERAEGGVDGVHRERLLETLYRDDGGIPGSANSALRNSNRVGDWTSASCRSVMCTRQSRGRPGSPAGTRLVAAAPARPGVSELAGGGGHWLGGQAGEAACFGGADLDQAGLAAGRVVVCGGGQLAGVVPGCGLAGGRAADVWAGRCRACGGDGQQGVGAHGQHGVAVEGLPGPDLMLVEADLVFSLLEAFFHRPSFPCDPDQGGQGHRAALRGVAEVEGQVFGVGQAAAYQDPVRGLGGAGPGPFVVAVTFAAAPARAGLPRRARDHGGHGGYGRLPAGRQRDGEVHRHCQHVSLAGLLAGFPQFRAAAVYFVAGHPRERDPGVCRAGNHLRAQGRLGGERRLLRHVRLLPPRLADAPGFGQVEPEIGQYVGAGGDVGGEHHRLAVLHLPGDPGMLPGHAGGPLLQLGGLV
jgi:hypothetical protein